MTRYLTISIFLALALIARAEEYLDMARLVSQQGPTAVFESTGNGEKPKDIEVNAQKSLFHQLFYKGVEGINDGKPLVVMENKIYTNSFFNETNRYVAYIVPQTVQPVGKAIKTGTSKMATFQITIRLQQLLNDMKRNKVYNEDAIYGVEATEVRETEDVVLPTVMVVPYKRDGESYSKILQSDYDRRIAVSSVQDGFEQRNISTVDLQGKIDAVARRMAYEQNAGNADSSDKQLLMTSGADVYVTVDIIWTAGVLLVVGIGLQYVSLDKWISSNTALMIILATLIGIIPESGPHMIFVTLYASGLVPLPVLLASSISQDGHSSLPLLAESRKSFLWAKLINCVVALVIGFGSMLFY